MGGGRGRGELWCRAPRRVGRRANPKMTPPLPLPLDLHPTPNSNPYLLGASIPDPECVLVTLPARPWAGGPPRTTSGCRGTRGSTGAAASRCRPASESGRARTAASRAWAPRTRACASAASTRAATRRARRRARARVQRGRRSCMPSSVILPRFIKSEFSPPPCAETWPTGRSRTARLLGSCRAGCSTSGR